MKLWVARVAGLTAENPESSPLPEGSRFIYLVAIA